MAEIERSAIGEIRADFSGGRIQCDQACVRCRQVDTLGAFGSSRCGRVLPVAHTTAGLVLAIRIEADLGIASSAMAQLCGVQR